MLGSGSKSCSGPCLIPTLSSDVLHGLVMHGQWGWGLRSSLGPLLALRMLMVLGGWEWQPLSCLMMLLLLMLLAVVRWVKLLRLSVWG